MARVERQRQRQRTSGEGNGSGRRTDDDDGRRHNGSEGREDERGGPQGEYRPLAIRRDR